MLPKRGILENNQKEIKKLRESQDIEDSYIG
jgi:hypothetical protein